MAGGNGCVGDDDGVLYGPKGWSSNSEMFRVVLFLSSSSLSSRKEEMPR